MNILALKLDADTFAVNNFISISDLSARFWGDNESFCIAFARKGDKHLTIISLTDVSVIDQAAHGMSAEGERFEFKYLFGVWNIYENKKGLTELAEFNFITNSRLESHARAVSEVSAVTAGEISHEVAKSMERMNELIEEIEAHNQRQYTELLLGDECPAEALESMQIIADERSLVFEQLKELTASIRAQQVKAVEYLDYSRKLLRK